MNDLSNTSLLWNLCGSLIMEDEIKTFLLLSRPNYFNFLYKQDEDLTQEVIEIYNYYIVKIR